MDNRQQFDINLVFTHPAFRPHVHSLIRDIVAGQVNTQVDDAFKYRVPYHIDAMLTHKLPGHIETYFRNHPNVQGIIDKTCLDVEARSRQVLNRVSNEDPYQNAVFGPFMTNLEQRCASTLTNTRREHADSIKKMHIQQNVNSVGLIGAIGLGIYAAFFRS